MDEIYLDNNSTTRLDRTVAEAMYQVNLMEIANPASQHRAGRQARQLLENSRDGLARHLGCRTEGMLSDQVILTSGGTESNNLALLGIRDQNTQSFSGAPARNCRLGMTIVSAIEHPSILGAAEAIKKSGDNVEFCPVDSDGRLNLICFSQLIDRHDLASRRGDLTDCVSLVSVMLANNETGVLQPIKEIVELCKPRGILVHVDAVQVLGKIPLSFRELDVDAMTVTAHKVHGPTGIGALVTRAGVVIQPQFFGGFQQLGIRPGTESVVLAVGFERAVSIAVGSVANRAARMLAMRESFETQLSQSLAMPTILGQAADRLPHTTSIAYPGFDRQALHMALDFAGIACSTGSACASGSGQPSHVLKAMGVDPLLLNGALRFSLSCQNTSEELDRAAVKINSVVETLFRRKPSVVASSFIST